MTKSISEILLQRPFKTRNADEYADQAVLEIFVDPTVGVSGPFEYGNEIVKGKMGSGKTMYLRANYLFYLSTLVPQLIEHNNEIILPVYIKLSDFQSIKDAAEIYNCIIIRLIKEIIETSNRLQSAEELVRLHTGIRTNYSGVFYSQNEVLEKINRLTADEYIEQVSKELCTSGTLGNNFVKACGSFEKKKFTELKKKTTPQLSDFIESYNQLLKPIGAQLLILFDEVGSIDKSFFEEQGATSFFETLMNQMRTLDFVRTKIAIYPHTFADILTETRYGDIVNLESDVYDENSYQEFLAKTISLSEKYLTIAAGESITVEDFFDVSKDNMQFFEQVIFASDGNMRRLVHLLDLTLNECYKRCSGKERVDIRDAYSAIKSQASTMKSLYYGEDLDFLNTLTDICKKRTAYKFKFPNKSPFLLKYTNKSAEYNIINIVEYGSGRRGTTYRFDYSYCVLADIPTHYQYESERIARSRSSIEGSWISTVTKISDELLIQAKKKGKIDGYVSYLNKERTVGFISEDNNKDYFFMISDIIETDKTKPLRDGIKVRFIPVNIGNTVVAKEIEIL